MKMTEPVDIYSYDILDTPDEQQFNDLIELASMICNVPISAITFIDTKKSRQWFKARKNLADSETPLDVSFCARAVAQNELLLVEDASKDEYFADYPNVTGGMKIRFYAGSPVRTSSGKSLGTLCVIDTKPRKLSDQQINALKKLSAQASRLMELRLLTNRLKRKSDKLLASAESYKDFFENAPSPQWIVDMETYRFLAVNKAARTLYGYTEDEFLRIRLTDITTMSKTALDQIQEKVNQEGNVQLITTHKKKDGSPVAVEITISTILYAGHTVSIVTTIDLSEKLRLQEDLIKEKKKFRKEIERATLYAQTQEREYLGRELHDNINQMLASTCMLLGIASSDDDVRLDLINRSQEYLLNTINEVRTLSHKLAEGHAQGLNLTEAIQELLEPYYMNNAFEIDYSREGELNRLPVDVKISLLRIIQEGFQNISKYAQATKVEMRLVADGKVSLLIKDNGKGFNLSDNRQGIGLRNIHERTEKLKGVVSIESALGKGCTIQVLIPL